MDSEEKNGTSVTENSKESYDQPKTPPFDFDLVVSFAGEDRDLVSSIVERCKEEGYAVFYDEDEVASMWGEELTEYFANTYENRAKAALMFVSEHYARKAWTTHERRSILTRALNQAPSGTGPYLFPIRIDDTKLSGVRESIAYVDARKYSPEDIVGFIREKIGEPTHSAPEVVTRTPRTDEECGALLSERPMLWEYYYTAYLFIQAVYSRTGRIRDVQSGFYSPGVFVDTPEVLQRGTEEMVHLLGIVRAFEGLFTGPLQAEALGKPGKPGDIDSIEYLGNRYGKVLDMLLEWSERVGGYSTISDEASEYFRALLRYAEQPLAAVMNFPEEFRAQVDTFYSIVTTGEDIHLDLPITWEVPEEVSTNYENAQQQMRESL